jgi:hypothetical protein
LASSSSELPISPNSLSVVPQKSLYLFCHSGPDPESSFFNLDSCWSFPVLVD